MPSLYELDSEPEDNLRGDDSASETSENLLDESVSFIRPQDRPKKRPRVSRTAVLVTFLIVLVVFTVATTSSIRKRHQEQPGMIHRMALSANNLDFSFCSL
jgi:hypothetical protein